MHTQIHHNTLNTNLAPNYNICPNPKINLNLKSKFKSHAKRLIHWLMALPADAPADLHNCNWKNKS